MCLVELHYVSPMSGVLQTPELGAVARWLVILPRITIMKDASTLKCLSSARTTGAVIPHGRPVIRANGLLLSNLGRLVDARVSVLPPTIARWPSVLGTHALTARGSCRVIGGLTLIVATAVLALRTVSASDFNLGLILSICALVAIVVLCMTWCIALGLTMKPRLNPPAGSTLVLVVTRWTLVVLSSCLVIVGPLVVVDVLEGVGDGPTLATMSVTSIS